MRHANSQALLLRIAARLVLINPAQVELLATPFKHELPAARIADFDEFIDGEPRVVMQASRQATLLLTGFNGCILQSHAAILHHITNSVR